MKIKYLFKIFGLGKIIATKAAKPKLIAGNVLNKGINALMIFLSYLFILILVITLIKDALKTITPKTKQEISIISLESNNFTYKKLFKEFQNPDYKISYKSFDKESDLLKNTNDNDIIIISSKDFQLIKKNNILTPLDEDLKQKLTQDGENIGVEELSNAFISVCEDEDLTHPEEKNAEQDFFCSKNNLKTVCDRSKKYLVIGQLKYKKSKEMLVIIRHLKNYCDKQKDLLKRANESS
jgi:hypothetical protein